MGIMFPSPHSAMGRGGEKEKPRTWRERVTGGACRYAPVAS